MLTFLLLAAAVAGGVCLTCPFDDEATLPARLCAGTVIVWTIESLAGYVVAFWVGLGVLACIGALVVGLAPLVLLRGPGVRARLTADARRFFTHGRDTVVGLAVVLVFAGVMCSRAYYEKPDGIYTGDLHNYGDLGFHLAITCDFLYGQRFPPEHPSFGLAGLTYPFIPDFGCALLVAAGDNIQDAYFVTATLIFVCMIGLMIRWVKMLTRDALAARLAVLLFLFSGGLGWWTFLRDVHNGGEGLFHMLGHLTRDYTISPTTADGLRWGNTVTALLLSQRTLTVGISLALVVFTLWWQALRGDKTDMMMRRMAAAGCITGLLPLTHSYSFIVVLGLGACLFLICWSRGDRATSPAWGVFFACALLIGWTQSLGLMAGNRMKASTFLSWAPGWDHGSFAVLPFWFYNTGLFIPLLLIAFIVCSSSEEGRVMTWYCAPFTVCFIVPNLLKLAPWVWDNIKVLVYWLIGSVPLVGLLLARLLRGTLATRILAVSLMLVLTAAGALDIWRVFSGQIDQVIIDRPGMEFALRVREATPPGAMVLHAAVANHPLVLSGRRHLLGYVGHVWSQGYDGGTRDSEIRAVYTGAVTATEILKRYHIDYIAVGPQERATLTVNDSFLRRFPPVVQSGPYALYRATIP